MAMTSPDIENEDEDNERVQRLVDILLLRQQRIIAEKVLDESTADPTRLEANEDTPVEDASLLNEVSELEKCLVLLEKERRKRLTKHTNTSERSTDRSVELSSNITQSLEDDRDHSSLTDNGNGSLLIELYSSSTHTNDFPSGSQKIGRFEIVRELGRGGLGVVLLANDPLLHRQVALKVPRPEALFTPSLRQRFQREAMAAARLTHPGIVPVYEVGEAGPIQYIAAAFIEGKAWRHGSMNSADRLIRETLL